MRCNTHQIVFAYCEDLVDGSIMKRTPLIATTLLAMAGLAAVSQAATLKFGGPINASQEVVDPPIEGIESNGAAILTLDSETGLFDLTVNISGVEVPITAAHIHMGAAGENGPVILPLVVENFSVLGEFVSYSLVGASIPAEGEVDGAPLGSLQSLLSGKAYLNFHTERNSGGELRGQLNPMAMNSDALVNFSTRGMVNPGNGKAGLLIGGLALSETKTILFRMVAESMTRFGVQTSLKDTSFEIFQLPFGSLQETELVGGNDNWKDSGQQFQILGTGYAPAFDNESAVIMTLDPGVYTMNADSEQGAGIALVETYGIEMSTIEDFLNTAAGGELAQEFTILSAALKLGEVEDFLQGPGPFTLFAPTDEAFLSVFTLEQIQALPPEDIATLLLAHIVGGSVVSADLTDGVTATVDSLDGGQLDVLLSGGAITVDNANVIGGDIMASNGVIHVIDAVLEVEVP